MNECRVWWRDAASVVEVKISQGDICPVQATVACHERGRLGQGSESAEATYSVHSECPTVRVPLQTEAMYIVHSETLSRQTSSPGQSDTPSHSPDQHLLPYRQDRQQKGAPT